MKLNLDQYANLDSPIHRWKQSSKLVAMLALIFAFAFVKQLILLPAMVIVTAIFYALSRLPLSFFLSRLQYPGFFLIAVVLFLPFLAGEKVIFSLAMLTIKEEGCLAVVLITTRFICILTISLVLFGSAPFLTTIKAMQSLGLSQIIIDMMLLSYRYLEELDKTLTNMQRAIRLRGFQGKGLSLRNLNILAKLAGNLLVRSYDQSKRVYQAMILRGYGNIPQNNPFKSNSKFNQNNTSSRIAFWATLIVAISFIVAEIIISQKLQYSKF